MFRALKKVFESLKKFIRKLLKMHYFSMFSHILTRHGVNLCAFGRKTQCAENSWENFRKFWKAFLRKLQKMDYFSISIKWVYKKFVNFLQVWTKKKIYWKSWENFRKFWKDFLRKLRKCIILAYLSNKFTNFALLFARLEEKHNLMISIGKYRTCIILA